MTTAGPETLDLSDAERVWLLAYADEQVATYRPLLTAAGLEAMRDALVEALVTNPGTRELIRRLAPPAQIDESGTNKLDRAALEETDADTRRRAGGK